MGSQEQHCALEWSGEAGGGRFELAPWARQDEAAEKDPGTSWTQKWCELRCRDRPSREPVRLSVLLPAPQRADGESPRLASQKP